MGVDRRQDGTGTSLPAAEGIQSHILWIRHQRVLLDQDLARLYGVPVKALNQAVRRNAPRFPEDFAFRLTPHEALSMRSHFVTASTRNVRHRPVAFTEHGAIMAASVLRSRRAEEVAVLVVRAFVGLRRAWSSQRALVGKLAELERRLDTHDSSIREIMTAIRDLMDPPNPPKQGRIGFHRE